MNVKYTARMQFGPHEDSATILNEVLGTCEAGRIDEVMFFAFAEEQNDGHDGLERIGQWLDAIRPWKSALEARGIEVSLNPWHSLLHTDRYRALKADQSWRTMMDWRGREATAVVCPLDPGWREYYREAMKMFASERFRVVWIDDDIRYHNHDPLDWGGCFCPLHVAEFNRRAGTDASREEIVWKILAEGEPHSWRAVWFDMWDELHCELISTWRDIVESAGSRLGLMSSNLEVHAMEGRDWRRWWKAFAGKFAATHRPHFWGYGEDASSVVVYGIGQMQQNRAVQPEGTESDPEIECFPYGPWNKSFRQTLAQMALAQVFGSTRLAVSLYDFMGNLPSDEPERAAFLARVKPMLGWLGEQFAPTLKSVGIGVPWHQDMSRLLHTSGESDWRSLAVETRGWDQWLAAFGFAFQKTAHSSVNALAGGMPWAFDDATLRDWLSKGVLLDGPAAAIMEQRGFGTLIGIENSRFVTQADALYSMEKTTDAEFGLRTGARMSLNADKPYKDRLLQGTLLGGAREISILCEPKDERVGHGAYVFENALGGRVAVMPWDVSAGTNLCTQRQAQLRKTIEWIARGLSTGSVYGGAWLVPQFLTDGKTWRGVIWNASPDAVTEMTVEPPEPMGPIVSAIQCDAEGELTPASVSENHVRLSKPMHQWEFVVLNGSV